MTMLSPHFSLAELTRSSEASARGYDNTPPAALLPNLRVLAAGLEEVRRIVGRPIIVSSGYRSLHANALVGGSKTSAHMRGLAADISVPGMTPQAVCRAILAAGLDVDQLIREPTWTHVGFAPSGVQPRRSVLTKTLTGYKPGIA